MKKFWIISPTILVTLFLYQLINSTYYSYPNSEREKFAEFIENHPFTTRNITVDEFEKIPKKDRPDLAMEQDFLMTLDPSTKTVPRERLISAFKGTKKKFKKAKERVGKSDIAISGVEWREIGPDNVGGRTRALMWDPNDPESKKLWAGSVSGGIWYNEDVIDPNSSWEVVNDFLANLAISSLTYDPTNTNIFYASTGEGYFNSDAGRGAGIFKSEDAGQTWELLPSTQNSDFFYTQKVVVNDEGTVFATTRNNGVQRSTDEGDSWETVLSSSIGNALTTFSNDIEIAKNGDLYATTGIVFRDGRLYKSSDNGDNWQNITPPGGNPERIEISLSTTTDNNTIVYAVSSNGVDAEWFRKSEDGGDTWIDLVIPFYTNQSCNITTNDFTRSQAWYDLAIEVHPENGDVFALGGINVLRSANGGNSSIEVSYWTGACNDFVHADIHVFTFRPGFPDQLVIGHDGGISYSPDFGSNSNPSFENRINGYAVTQFYAVAADNEAGSGYFIAGAQDNGTQQFTSTNGLSTEEAVGGDGAFCHVDQTDRNFQIASTQRNSIRFSSNGGISFKTLTSQNSDHLFINPTDLDNQSHILYAAASLNQYMFIQGINSLNPDEPVFINANLGRISHINADSKINDRLFIGNQDGRIFRVDNANNPTPDITNLTNNIGTLGNVSSIAIGNSDDELIVTYSNFGVNSVWLSTDGGNNWINKDDTQFGLPDIPVRWSLFNPANTEQVFIATELGVWSTDDIYADNPNWEPTSENLANVRCNMLQYRESDDLIVVSTHGRGLFTTNAIDAKPPQITNLIPANNEENVDFEPEFKITFSEEILLNSGNIEIRRASDDSIVETIAIQSEQLVKDGNSISLNSAIVLESLTEYYILIEEGAISDKSGNQFNLNSSDSWSFTTYLTATPSNLIVEENNEGDILLNWTDNSDNETGFSIEKAILFNELTTLEFNEIATVSSNETSFIDDDVESNTTFVYRVRALNSSNSNYTDNSQILTIPSPPAPVVASNITETGFNINWVTSDNSILFEFDMSTDNFSTFVEGYENLEVGPERVLEIRDIEILNYQIRLRSLNAAGKSPNSEILEINLITNVPAELNSINDINIYPNPVRDNVNIDIPHQFNKDLKLVIYDLSGNRMFKRSITDPNNNISIRDLPSGIYLISIFGDGISTQKRLIKL